MRYTQPQTGPAKVEWGNPITKGLVFAWNGRNESMFGVSVSSNNRAATRSGVGQQIANSANVLTLTGLAFPTTNTITMAALVNRTGTGGTFAGIFGKWDGLNSQRPGFGLASGVLTLSNYPNNDSSLGATGALGEHFYAATNDGALSTGYVDGAVNGTQAKAVTWVANSDAWYVGCFRGGDQTENLPAIVLFAACWTRSLSAAEIASLNANPWQLFKSSQPLLSPVAVQLLRPGSDITAGAWTPSSGASLFATLNEAVASDATFDLTSQASTFEVGMTAGTAPGVTTGHVVRYRIVGAVTVSLRQGTTTIASWSQAPTAMTTYVQTLTSVQAAAITNYAALKLQFQAT